MLGSNDSKKAELVRDGYEAELGRLITTYRNLPSKPEVYVMTPPAATDNKPNVRPDVIAAEIVPIVRDVGTTMNVPVIDVYRPPEAPGLLPRRSAS